MRTHFSGSVPCPLRGEVGHNMVERGRDAKQLVLVADVPHGG